jgi:hypothetical protein
MEQQVFDASNILSKLRQNRSAQSPTVSMNLSNQLGRGSASNHSPAQLQRNRFSRKERPEVRMELENEVEHLTGEVARLRRENKHLQIEKEELEYRCLDVKEKSDMTISKLRNKLVALNKKFSDVNSDATSTQDRYVAKKHINNTFSKGAGVINTAHAIPSTVHALNASSSVQNMTFSQFMRRSDETEYSGELFNSTSRPGNHHHHHHQGDNYADSRHGGLERSVMLPEDIRNDCDFFSPQHTTTFDMTPEDNNGDHLNLSQTHSSATSKNPIAEGPPASEGGRPVRSKSIAPPPRSLEDPRRGSELTDFMVSSELEENRNRNYDHNDDDDGDDDDELIIVDIDLRT